MKHKIIKTMIGVIAAALLFPGFSPASGFDRERAARVYSYEIDHLITSFKERLYLIDSKHSALSRVGWEAVRMLCWLRIEKKRLVYQMTERQIDFRPIRIQSYVMEKAKKEAFPTETYLNSE